MDRSVSNMLLIVMLSLISCAAAAAAEKGPKCEGVNKTLPREDLHKIFGDWVLVWSVTDTANGWESYNASTSQLRLHLHPDNKTIVYEERNHLRNSSCHLYIVNLLADHSKAERHALKTINGTLDYGGHAVPYVDAGHVYLYESNSPNDLVLVYDGRVWKFLLIYRRKGHHTGAELKSHHKQHQDRAACLGIPVNSLFIYEEVSELCHECDRIKKNLPREELHQIFGDWVLVWAATNSPKGWDFFNFTSSHVHLYLHPDNRTVVYHGRSLLRNSSCHIWKVNMLADPANTERHVLNITSGTVDYDGHVVPFPEIAHLELYERGTPDDLVLVYRDQEVGFLLMYRRKGHVLEANPKHQQERADWAACMGFPLVQSFDYDGVSESCAKKED